MDQRSFRVIIEYPAPPTPEIGAKLIDKIVNFAFKTGAEECEIEYINPE